MSKQFSEVPEYQHQRKMGVATAYSAHIQEAMRYDKLHSTDYPLVMTILHAVSEGYTEEQWEDGQQRSLTLLRQQPPMKGSPYADSVNRYEQIVSNLKDLELWPW